MRRVRPGHGGALEAGRGVRLLEAGSWKLEADKRQY